MNLIELTAPPSTAYPVAAFADHLKLGSGFSDDGSQDAVLEICLRAAVSAVEGRTGKVVLTRRFQWELARWYSPVEQGLPVGPVRVVESVSLVTQDGTETQLATDRYTLIQDSQRPRLAARTSLPQITVNGAAKIVFSAGYGDTWAEVPKDLQRAIFGLAAHYYERRHEGTGLGDVMPFGVLSLLDRYRPVRLTGDRL